MKDHLLRTLEKLEREIAALRRTAADDRTLDDSEVLHSDDHETLLDPLRDQMEGDGAKMGVVLAGILRPNGEEQSWVSIKTGDDDEVVPEQVADLVVPFSSPQRVALMKALIGGSLTASALEGATGQTGGQMYHHLRELKHASLVTQDARGEYRLTRLGSIEYLALGLVTHTRRNALKSGIEL